MNEGHAIERTVQSVSAQFLTDKRKGKGKKIELLRVYGGAHFTGSAGREKIHPHFDRSENSHQYEEFYFTIFCS